MKCYIEHIDTKHNSYTISNEYDIKYTILFESYCEKYDKFYIILALQEGVAEYIIEELTIIDDEITFNIAEILYKSNKTKMLNIFGEWIELNESITVDWILKNKEVIKDSKELGLL